MKNKRKIKDGRWEVDGAMWLEADCNLPSGESFVRQILKGEQFFGKEFGIRSKTLWLPDVFGYSAALPQILNNLIFLILSPLRLLGINTTNYQMIHLSGVV